MYKKLRKFIVKRFVVIIVLLVALFSVVFFWLNPLLETQVKIVKNLRSEKEAQEKSLSDLAFVKRDIEEIDRLSADLFSSFPGQNEIYRVIDQLEKIAGNSGVSQEIVVHDELIEKQGTSSVKIEIVLSGNKADLIKYLEQLEKMRFYFQEQKISYQSRYIQTGDDNLTEGVQANLELLVCVAPAAYY